MKINKSKIFSIKYSVDGACFQFSALELSTYQSESIKSSAIAMISAFINFSVFFHENKKKKMKMKTYLAAREFSFLINIF